MEIERFTSPPSYTSVKALMISWEDTAQKAFKSQLLKLSTVLKAYKFDVEEFEIESVKPFQTLSERLHRFLRNDQDGALLIIYYGGHGMNNQDKNNIWLCHDPATVRYQQNPKVNWSALQSLFLDDCSSHVLFLLDCCFAAASVQCTEGSSTVEAIVASGFEGVAPLRGEHSFTTFLTATLEECRNRHESIYVSRLCTLVASRLNRTEWLTEETVSKRVTPHHLVFSNKQNSVIIRTLESTGECNIASRPNAPGPQQSRWSDPKEPPTPSGILNAERISVGLPVRGDCQGTELTTLSGNTDIGSPPMGTYMDRMPSAEGNPLISRKRTPANFDSSDGWESYSETKKFSSGSEFDDWRRLYDPVQSNEIRTLHINPSDKITDPILCQFYVQNITADHTKDYKALSWVWGQVEGDEQEIFILDQQNKYSVPVRPNLASALRYIRDPRKKVVLWVDILCINQTDITERSAQLSIITTIFRRAAEVIVWLGSENDHINEAIDWIPRLLDLNELDVLVKNDSTPKQWRALVTLMMMPYFSRRWVFLEVILAKKAMIYCGSRRLSWPDFCDAVILLASRFEEIQILCKRAALSERSREFENLVDLRALGAYSVVEASRNLFRRHSDGSILSSRNLETLVSYLPALDAMDPRDVIYALIPVASDRTSIAFKSDYSSTVSDVYQQFVRHCAESSMTIDIICRPWAPSRENFSIHLPSWICQTQKLPFGKRRNDVSSRRNGDVLVGYPERSYYDAARRSVAVPIFGQAKSASSLTVLDESMTVSGFAVGRINEIGFRSVGGTIYTEWIEMCGWRPGEEFVPDHLWRTLVADRGPGGTATPPWYRRACHYWLNYCHGDDIPFELLLRGYHPSIAVQYMQRVQCVIWNRRLFITTDGLGRKLYGLAPQRSEKGDSVCILHGCSVPVVLRPRAEFWELVGECFVYGIMDGEAMQTKAYTDKTQEFLLR